MAWAVFPASQLHNDPAMSPTISNIRLSISAAAALIAGILLALQIPAQSPAPRPEFDAASIKLNVDGTPYVFNGMKSLGTFSSVNQTLKNLIHEAYGAPSGQRYWIPFVVAPGQGIPIFGGPEWLGADRYDITAKWNVGPADAHMTIQSMAKAESEMNLMLQSLLEQRFQVKVHRETRDLPIYELTIGKPGKLKQAACITFNPDHPLPPSAPGQPPPDYCGASRLGRKGVDWTLNGTGMKMKDLADTLTWLIGDRTIVDKTGFNGTFDAHLRWTPGAGEFGARDAPASPDDAGSIFGVLQQQLGLKLKIGRGPVEVLVVDRAEKPSAN